MNNYSVEPVLLDAELIAAPTACLLTKRPVMRVLQLFGRSSNLVTEDGELLSLTLPGLEPGPFSIVVGAPAPGPARLDQILCTSNGALKVTADEDGLQIGRLHVNLRSASKWNPRLEQGMLKEANLAAAAGCLGGFLMRQAPADSLLSETSSNSDSRIGARMRKAWLAIEQAIDRGEPETCRDGAQLAAGAGIGLTPAGDDFLMGVILALWLTIVDPAPYINSMISGAAGRTGRLSLAFLQAASSGEAAQSWHIMAKAVARRDGRGIQRAARRLMAAGHTSGADAMLGFTLTLAVSSRQFGANHRPASS